MFEQIACGGAPGRPDRGRQGPARYAWRMTLPAGRRPPADRRRAGRRQDHAGARAGAVARAQVQPGPVHQRPAAGRRRRHFHLRTRKEWLRLFHPGPIFSQVLLADEINRATPKTQSGLLEAMEERQVTADGVTRALPEPFFVIATQNPAHQVGTFPLPESQLDRFLMCLSLGYPGRQPPSAPCLMGEDRRAMLKSVVQPSHAVRSELMEAQRALRAIHASGSLIDYLQALVLSSRSGQLFAEGLSPRATLALLQAARAWAAMEGRDHVIPEDIQALLVPVCAHRLRPLKAAHGTDDGQPRPRAAVAEIGPGLIHGMKTLQRPAGCNRHKARKRCCSTPGATPCGRRPRRLAHPMPPPATAARWMLGQRRVYILPTGAGIGFARAAAGAADRLDQLYTLGLGFGLTFLAAACAVVDMFAHLPQPGPSAPARRDAHPTVFAGEAKCRSSCTWPIRTPLRALRRLGRRRQTRSEPRNRDRRRGPGRRARCVTWSAPTRAARLDARRRGCA